MLATVAKRLYWLGRYLERAENTARLMQVSSGIALDLPATPDDFWRHIIRIIDSEEGFFATYDSAGDRNVNKYMLADKNHSGSLYHSVFMARENFRTTRDILTSAAWQEVNELYGFLKDNVQRAVAPRNRNDFLHKVINCCLILNGTFESTMSHNSGYHFIIIGRSLERADMTTRILDVGTAQFRLHKEQMTEAFENALLIGILQSLSAFQMYQQTIQESVNIKDMARFLLFDREFPRSVAYNLARIRHSTSCLPANKKIMREAVRVEKIVTEADIGKIMGRGGLHKYIDELQLQLIRLHDKLAVSWFGGEGRGRRK